MKRLAVVAVAGACGALFAPALALPDLAGRRTGEGLPLLYEATLAAEELPYQGTQIVSIWSEAGTTSAVVEVAHVPDAGTRLRLVPTATDPGRVVFRPAGTAGAGIDGSGLSGRALALIATNYEADLVGSEAVAGRLADVVVVRTAAGQPVARFWVDEHTRLVLRQQILDQSGAVVRESAYISIAFTASLPGRSELDATTSTVPAPGEQVALDAVDRLRAAGWQVPVTLASGMQLLDVRFHGSHERLHLTYHDGMSGVSVFQQPGRLDAGALAGWRQQQIGGADVWVSPTAPTAIAWSSSGIVYTVVADCPRSVLEDLVRALPHGERGPGVLTRMQRGAARVGSWFNPFA